MFVDTQILINSYYGFDSVKFPNDVYNIEAEAIGAKINHTDSSAPALHISDHFIKNRSDIEKIKSPDFFNDGRFPYQMDIFRQKKELGINLATFCAPLSLAVGLRTYTLFMNDLLEAPDFVDRFIQYLMDKVTLPYIKAINSNLGITRFRGSDTWRAVPMFTPDMLEDHMLKWNRRIIDKCAVDSPGIFGEELLKRCCDFHIACYKPFGISLQFGRKPGFKLEPFLRYAREIKDRYSGKKARIIIRIYSKLLRDGPGDKIIRYVKWMLDAFYPEFEVSF